MPTVALTDDLAEIKPQYRTFADWLATEPEEAADVIDLMRNPNVKVTEITGALRKNGIPCGKETVGKYRDGTL